MCGGKALIQASGISEDTGDTVFNPFYVPGEVQAKPSFGKPIFLIAVSKKMVPSVALLKLNLKQVNHT